MAEQLPSPRLGFRRGPEQAEDKGPFAEYRRSADEIAEELIEPHHIARDLVAFAA